MVGIGSHPILGFTSDQSRPQGSLNVILDVQRHHTFMLDAISPVLSSNHIHLPIDSGSSQTAQSAPQPDNVPRTMDMYPKVADDPRSSGQQLPLLTVQSSRSCRWATKDDWIQQRPRITELYRQHTLREVMSIMMRHGFEATLV